MSEIQYAKPFTTSAAVVRGQALVLSGGTVAPTTAITASTIGVAQDSAASGAVVMVNMYGIVRLKVDGTGAAITVGAELSPGTAGDAIVATGTGTRVCAVALQPSSVAGQLIDAAWLHGTSAQPTL